MKPELSTLWLQVLDLVAADIPKPSFETWVQPARPLAFYEDTIVVAAPNDLAKNRLESRYAEAITSALHKLTGKQFRLSIVLPHHAAPDQLHLAEVAATAPLPAPQPDSPAKLNPKYTFDTFVIGASNRFAHAASLAVAETPAQAYNPLFLYGGVGLGKTHLMHAIGHFVLEQNPNANIAYVSTETFTNEFINCLRDNKTLEFQSKYRSVDVLLIDDIQFLAGKERTQEEFYHTFNAIHEANKQIVISSDRPPKEIPTLEDRLRSRFEWGLICDIQPPDLETRIAILRKKAQTESLAIDDDILAYIATRIETNIRELEGALTRIVAYAAIHNTSADLAVAEAALKDILPPSKPRQVTIDLIQLTVAQHYNVAVEDFKLRKRTRSIAFPRQVAMYLARELTDLSLPKIGEEFGGRDHTTVIHACEKIANDMAHDQALASTIQLLINKIQGS